jgi:hypothetical protein
VSVRSLDVRAAADDVSQPLPMTPHGRLEGEVWRPWESCTAAEVDLTRAADARFLGVGGRATFGLLVRRGSSHSVIVGSSRHLHHAHRSRMNSGPERDGESSFEAVSRAATIDLFACSISMFHPSPRSRDTSSVCTAISIFTFEAVRGSSSGTGSAWRLATSMPARLRGRLSAHAMPPAAAARRSMTRRSSISISRRSLRAVP